MNRRTCRNCQLDWRSVSDEQLEAPHNCPACGDELGPLALVELNESPLPLAA